MLKSKKTAFCFEAYPPLQLLQMKCFLHPQMISSDRAYLLMELLLGYGLLTFLQQPEDLCCDPTGSLLS